jgi:hypothetical protein
MPWTDNDVSFKKLNNKRITTSTGKGINEEKGASTLELHYTDIKLDNIPSTPPGSSTSIVQVNTLLTLVEDLSVPNKQAWFATSITDTVTANNGSSLSESSRLKDWIPDKYDAPGTIAGTGYEIKVYDKDNILVPKADASSWFFDYQTGILVFKNANTDSGTVISRAPFKVTGYRYIGRKNVYWPTPRTVTFSGGNVTGSFTIDGSADVSGVVLTATASSSGQLNVTDDTTTNAPRYVSFTSVTSGAATFNVSSTKLTYNPSTGTLSSTILSSATILAPSTTLAIKPTTNATNSLSFQNSVGTNILTVDTVNNRIGIGTSSPSYDLEVNGEISATNKSFVINHPTKPDMKLRYGSLEGPENGVYVRGILKDHIIHLPDYWVGLVDENTITVNLTPLGNSYGLRVEKIENNTVFVKSYWWSKISCFYTVFAERKDVAKLKVEF